MRALALTALLAAAPASAQRLQAFEKQFTRNSDLGQKAVAGLAEASLRTAEAELDDGQFPTAAGLILLAPVYPFILSLDMDPRERVEHRLESSGQHIEDRVRAWGGRYRYSAHNHLAAEAHWTAYLEEGALYDLHYFGARAVGDLVDDERWTLEYGFGVSFLAGQRHRGGPDFSLGGELRPWKWLFLDARAGAVVMEGGTLGDLRAGAGLRRRGEILGGELRAAYRALMGPVRRLGGPEIGLAVTVSL